LGEVEHKVYCVLCRPAYAVPRILAKSGLTLDDIDVIEFHEAFAVSRIVLFHDPVDYVVGC